MRKPWNRPAHPVYSLSTENNMNICTYVTPITLKPKQYAVAVYYGTKTLENIRKQQKALLQLLTIDQRKYVRRFGYQSGKEKDKLKNLDLDYFGGIPFLPDCAALIALDVVEEIDVGDHVLFIMKVTQHKNINDKEILTTKHLYDAKIMK